MLKQFLYFYGCFGILRLLPPTFLRPIYQVYNESDLYQINFKAIYIHVYSDDIYRYRVDRSLDIFLSI